MGILGSLGRSLTTRGRLTAQYERGIAKAKQKDMPAAIADYSAVITARKVPPDLQAMALFNRALAYAFEKDHKKAQDDLERVQRSEGVPAEVRSAAKEKLERLQRWSTV